MGAIQVSWLRRAVPTFAMLARLFATNERSGVFHVTSRIRCEPHHNCRQPNVLHRECEGNALQMSKLDFNDDSEKTLVEQVFGNAMESLADEDRQLPQVYNIHQWRMLTMFIVFCRNIYFKPFVC